MRAFDKVISDKMIDEYNKKHDIQQEGKTVLYLSGLHCANCALKIENKLKQDKNFSNVKLNFIDKKLTLDSQLSNVETIKRVQKLVNNIEKGVTVVSEETETSFNYKKFQIISAVVLYVLAIITQNPIIMLVTYMIAGYDVLWMAIKNMIHGKMLDENFLMAIASIGAIVLNEFLEACTVMVLYQIGEYLQELALNRSRKSIKELVNIKPNTARIKKGNQYEIINSESLKKGDVIQVVAGEKVACDGRIISGYASLDTKAITGETKLQNVAPNDLVVGGVINTDGVLEIKLTVDFNQSTIATIIKMIDEANDKKAKAEKFITKFAKIYTPLVVLFALLIAFLPPLLIKGALFSDYIYRALTFLVISCPCALVISVPLSYFAGVGGLSKQGILVKGSNFIDELSNTSAVVFDKTGTITDGKLVIQQIISEDVKQCVYLAQLAEQYSNHPIAKSILNYDTSNTLVKLTNVKEISGKGIMGEYDDKLLIVGNQRIMNDHNIEVTPYLGVGSIIYVAYDNRLIGYIVINDSIKYNAAEVIENLKQKQIKTYMLSGDNEDNVRKVADEIGIDQYYASLLPQDKVHQLENIKKSHKVIYIGDGVNDAPVLKLADVGIAMGMIGSDVAIETSDVVIMNDNLQNILVAIDGSKKINKIVQENIIGAILVKIVVLLLGAFGFASMWLAVFSDVGVALLAILNAIRALRIEK